MTDTAENNEQQEQEGFDLGALSDEEISTMSPTQVEEALKNGFQQEAGSGEESDSSDDASEPDEDQDGAQSAAGSEEEGTDSEETGGADSEFQSLDTGSDVADLTLDEESDEDGNADESSDGADQSGEDDQSSEADGDPDDEEAESEDVDYKAKFEEAEAKYNALMGEFKASGRTVKPESPDDARRLMQMGYDYTQKMRAMKPHLKILKTLEHNGLLEPEKINFLIDLEKGNEEAVKKFLRDNKIDPIELDMEDGTGYKPTDHQVSDAQVALDEVLDSIRTTDAFETTARIITKDMDKASQSVLMGNPSLIPIINDHVANGFYDKISAKVQYERSLGRLTGLSDLEAYKTVGDAMQAQGAFSAPAETSNTETDTSGQEPSQDSKGSDGDKREDVRNRKKAASSTKGNASAGKAPPKNYLGEFSDEEIAAM